MRGLETGRLGDREAGRLGDLEQSFVKWVSSTLPTSYFLPLTFYLRAIVSHFVSWRQFNQIKNNFVFKPDIYVLIGETQTKTIKNFWQ